MIAIINFIMLIISLFLFSLLYVLSIQPAKHSEKYGEKAWEDCKKLRSISGFFEMIVLISIILWIWFPLPLVNTWIISQNIWVGVIVAACITIPCLILMFKGIIDAGSETLTPSKETEMYGGIYKYIRHPQSAGEFPTFIAMGFLVNSWFLVVLMSIYIILYIPIMVYYEEKDLIRRFGEKYVNYQSQTGALFPKFRK
jgi:protein-S-isoprenylcysteine O-methyltransferase Ste14